MRFQAYWIVFSPCWLLISNDFYVCGIFEEIPDDHSNYPKSIRPFPIRKEYGNHNLQVERGRLQILGGLPLKSTARHRRKVSLEEFKTALQA